MLAGTPTYYALQNVAGANAGNWTVSTPQGAFGGPITIELDGTQITRPGRYVVIKSAATLTGYQGATVVWATGTAGSLNVKGATASGSTGEPINYSGTTYYCVVVTVG